MQAKVPLATVCGGGPVSLSEHCVTTNTFPLWVTGWVSRCAWLAWLEAVGEHGGWWTGGVIETFVRTPLLG